MSEGGKSGEWDRSSEDGDVFSENLDMIGGKLETSEGNLDMLGDGCCVSHVMDGKEVTRMRTGEYFGAAALADATWKRRRGVRAIARCELFELTRKDVMVVCRAYPSLRESPPVPLSRPLPV